MTTKEDLFRRQMAWEATKATAAFLVAVGIFCGLVIAVASLLRAHPLIITVHFDPSVSLNPPSKP